MRSGSGTSRTTTTSDSGDYYDNNFSTPQPSRSHPTLSSSLSPSRPPAVLPGAYSPAQPSSSSTASTFSIPSPAVQPQAAMSSSLSAASALSQYATRMRERDADAMEKYKNRQRSGSGTTASTDVTSQSGSNPAPVNGMSKRAEDDIAALTSLVTVGSVAPRRNLRPSASAAQLRSPVSGAVSPTSTQSSSQELLRNRSGTGPATSGPSIPLSAQTPDPTSTPMQTPTLRSTKAGFSGPPTDYARFPPPPPPASTREPIEATPKPTSTTPTTQSRRLPFGNLLSSHHKHNSEHASGHKRNSSLGARVA